MGMFRDGGGVYHLRLSLVGVDASGQQQNRIPAPVLRCVPYFFRGRKQWLG